MAIPVQCPHCQRSTAAPDEYAGRKVKCRCGGVFVVPAPAPAAAAPPAGSVFDSLDESALAGPSLAPSPRKRSRSGAAGGVFRRMRESKLGIAVATISLGWIILVVMVPAGGAKWVFLALPAVGIALAGCAVRFPLAKRRGPFGPWFARPFTPIAIISGLTGLILVAIPFLLLLAAKCGLRLNLSIEYRDTIHSIAYVLTCVMFLSFGICFLSLAATIAWRLARQYGILGAANALFRVSTGPLLLLRAPVCLYGVLHESRPRPMGGYPGSGMMSGGPMHDSRHLPVGVYPGPARVPNDSIARAPSESVHRAPPRRQQTGSTATRDESAEPDESGTRDEPVAQDESVEREERGNQDQRGARDERVIGDERTRRQHPRRSNRLAPSYSREMFLGSRASASLRLLRFEAVQDDLGLTAEQKERIRALEQSTSLGPPPRQGSMQGLSHDEWIRRNQEINQQMQQRGAQRDAQIDQALPEILQPAQLERLGQIRLQVIGTAALDDPDVRRSLGITAEQRSRMTRLRAEHRSEMQGRAGSRMSLRERREQRNARDQELEQRLMNVLTADQKAKLERMKGKIVDIGM